MNHCLQQYSVFVCDLATKCSLTFQLIVLLLRQQAHMQHPDGGLYMKEVLGACVEGGASPE